VAGRLTEKLVQRVSGLLVSESLEKNCDVSALTCDWQVETTRAAVEEARSEGAQVVIIIINNNSFPFIIPH
jgi:acyl-CoA reductase-like NAD-dependent aldehyde dehydrogenase